MRARARSVAEETRRARARLPTCRVRARLSTLSALPPLPPLQAVWVIGWACGESIHIAPHKQDKVDEKQHRTAAYSRRDLLSMPYSPSLVGMPSPSPDIPRNARISKIAADTVPPLDLNAAPPTPVAASVAAPAAPAAAATTAVDIGVLVKA